MIVLYDNSRIRDLTDYLDTFNSGRPGNATQAQGIAFLEFIEAVLNARRIHVADFELTFKDASFCEEEWQTMRTLRELLSFGYLDGKELKIERLRVGPADSIKFGDFHKAVAAAADGFVLDVAVGEKPGYAPEDLPFAAFPEATPDYVERRDKRVLDIINNAFPSLGERERQLRERWDSCDGIAECVLLLSNEDTHRRLREHLASASTEGEQKKLVACIATHARVRANAAFAALAATDKEHQCFYQPAPARSYLLEQIRHRVCRSSMPIFKPAVEEFLTMTQADDARWLELMTSVQHIPVAYNAAELVWRQADKHRKRGPIHPEVFIRAAAKVRRDYVGDEFPDLLSEFLSVRQRFFERDWSVPGQGEDEVERVLRKLNKALRHPGRFSDILTSVGVNALNGLDAVAAALVAISLPHQLPESLRIAIGLVGGSTLGTMVRKQLLAASPSKISRCQFVRTLDGWGNLRSKANTSMQEVWGYLGVGDNFVDSKRG